MNTHELISRLANVQQAIRTCESAEINDPYYMKYYTKQLLEEQFLLDELSTSKSWLHAFYLNRAIGTHTSKHERQYWLDKLHGRVK